MSPSPNKAMRRKANPQRNLDALSAFADAATLPVQALLQNPESRRIFEEATNVLATQHRLQRGTQARPLPMAALQQNSHAPTTQLPLSVAPQSLPNQLPMRPTTPFHSIPPTLPMGIQDAARLLAQFAHSVPRPRMPTTSTSAPSANNTQTQISAPRRFPLSNERTQVQRERHPLYPLSDTESESESVVERAEGE